MKWNIISTSRNIKGKKCWSDGRIEGNGNHREVSWAKIQHYYADMWMPLLSLFTVHARQQACCCEELVRSHSLHVMSHVHISNIGGECVYRHFNDCGPWPVIAF